LIINALITCQRTGSIQKIKLLANVARMVSYHNLTCNTKNWVQRIEDIWNKFLLLKQSKLTQKKYKHKIEGG